MTDRDISRELDSLTIELEDVPSGLVVLGDPAPRSKRSPRDHLMAVRRDINEEAFRIMLEKNSGYATEADPILNYRRAAESAGTTPAQYINGRMQEKVTRAGVLLSSGRLDDVTEELVDIINLCAIVQYAMEADG